MKRFRNVSDTVKRNRNETDKNDFNDNYQQLLYIYIDTQHIITFST